MGRMPVIGETFCHYRIVERIGVGGMGEVYRATDTKLGRDVALKFLPEAFAKNGERMARFRREAQVLALLNHPNIATIYGLEESNGNCALAMELVDGPTLAGRITGATVVSGLASPTNKATPSGVPMPLDETLPIAKQVADGLEYAHDRGIVHRDLKPANVKVRPDGTVKILDFGLAKGLEETPAAGSINTSPTKSAAATREGIILGTAAYMSPEQARGKTVDRRCDIWSFAAVLFEMLSGKQAFAGEDVSHTLAAVIMKEPDWSVLPNDLPAAVARLVRRCLTKEPRNRLQAIGEARIVIDECLAGTADVEAGHVPAPGRASSTELIFGSRKIRRGSAPTVTSCSISMMTPYGRRIASPTISGSRERNSERTLHPCRPKATLFGANHADHKDYRRFLARDRLRPIQPRPGAVFAEWARVCS